MKLKSSLTILIIMMIVSPTLFSSETSATTRIKLAWGTASLRIEYDEKREDVAAYYLDKAANYIPALEKYLGFPFPLHYITIWLDEKPGHAYKYSYGVKLVRHHLVTKYPAVLYHEFGHFYYRGWTEKWLVEGINSFLPIAIADYGFLTREDADYNAVMRTWGFYSVHAPHDAPVIIDFRRKVWHFYYVKTFKIQYLIYRELGKEKYRKFVQDVSREMKKSTYSNFSTLLLLNRYKRINWREFLSGWVYEGDYKVFSYKDFGDNNGNGIVDVIDFYTNNPSGMSVDDGENE